MDKNGATQRTSRYSRAAEIDGFLRQALAGGEMSVAALEERAHTAGLLVEGQSISDAKLFKSAKAALGIRSHRVGFGRGAVWFWSLPAPPASEVTTPVTLPPDAYDVGSSDRAPETSPCARNAGERPRGAPLEWTRGVNILQQRPRPFGIPLHRWRLFVEDCRRFVASPWAKLAAGLGWDAGGLFGSRYTNAHEHLGAAGLLWNLQGGQISRLHRDGAAFVTADGSARTFHRRPARTMSYLPGC